MNKKNLRTQGGLTIIELLIVLAIGAVLVTFATTLLGGAKDNLQRQNIAREFKTSLERARFDSVKRRSGEESSRAVVRVINTTSYSVTTDLNQNGVLDVGETRTVDFSHHIGVQLLVPTGITTPVSIAFDQRGHAIIGDYDGDTTDHFTFCGGGCTLANANPSNSNAVYISSTGTVAMLAGGESVPAFSVPGVSNVNSASGVNPDVSIWTGDLPASAPTPTPSPSVTPLPTASPTPTPVASPTPTPTPGATPLPTASPTPLPACTTDQRPGSPPTCQCNAPRLVGRNGKCSS